MPSGRIWCQNGCSQKSVLLCPGPGTTGFNALGSIIAGEVNPSGKTTDTWVRELSQTPYINNIGHFAYTNTQNVADAAKAAWERADGIVSFVNYTEGIYTGYRFYETAADENLIDYDQVVMYPFGYGLSYTTFDQEMSNLLVTDDSISVDVTVTNTGKTAGNEAIMTDLSATSVIAMRQAAKNIFYTVVNSNAYEDYVPGQIPSWMQILYIVDAVLTVLLVLAEVVLIRGYLKKRKSVIIMEEISEKEE